MSARPTIDLDTLSIIGPEGSDLIAQTEGVPPIENQGYRGFLALSARLLLLADEGVLSPDEHDRLRGKLRVEARRRNYDLIHQAEMAGEVAEGTTVRIELCDDEPKIKVATADTEALKGAEQVAREYQARIERLSPSMASFEFVSVEHQRMAGDEMFSFWLSETNVTAFKGGRLPYAVN